MPDLSFVVQSFRFIAFFTACSLSILCLGSFVASFFRILFQIDDGLLNFFSKFLALALSIYFGASYFSREFLDFAKAIWDNQALYL